MNKQNQKFKDTLEDLWGIANMWNALSAHSPHLPQFGFRQTKRETHFFKLANY